MPHIIIEHSKGIAKTLYIQKLLGKLHGAAIAHPNLPLGGIRTRVHDVERYHNQERHKPNIQNHSWERRSGHDC